MSTLKVRRLDVSAAIVHATNESDIHVTIGKLDPEYYALVSEVEDNGKFEGTLLYVPGMMFKELKVKLGK
ncbi:MAG: hypothetical protein ACRD32_08560 [Nitrososphaerales archaeon]